MSSNLFLLIHSWYPTYCCSGQDCRPVPCDQLIEQQDGTVLYQGIKFLANTIHPSQDALCHVCYTLSSTIVNPICAFLQYSY